MLHYETSPTLRRKKLLRVSLLNVLLILAGIKCVVDYFYEPRTADDLPGQHLLVATFGFFVACQSAQSLWRDLTTGAQRVRLIVNSRTLAIKRGGKRAEFIKRRNCASVVPRDCQIHLRNGERKSIQESRLERAELEKQFWQPFLDLWWPGLSNSAIDTALAQERKAFRRNRCIALAVVLHPVLFAFVVLIFAKEHLTQRVLMDVLALLSLWLYLALGNFFGPGAREYLEPSYRLNARKYPSKTQGPNETESATDLESK